MRTRMILGGIWVFAIPVLWAEPQPKENQPAGEETPPAVSGEPALRTVLEKAEKFLAKQKTVHVVSDYRWESGVEGKMETGQKKIEGWLVRPGQFRLTITPHGSEAPDLLVVGDGKTAYTYLPKLEIYSAGPVVGPKAGLERNVVVSQALSGSGLEITWRPDLARFVLTQAQNVLDRGVEQNKDIEGRHFSFSFGDVRFQVWFTVSEEPILKRVKRSTRLQTAGRAEPFELEIVSDLTWTFNPPTEEKLFKFSRSASAQRVSDLYAHLSGEDPAARSPAEIALTTGDGKEAPLPAETPLMLLIAPSWDEDAGVLYREITKGLAQQGTKASAGIVVIGDDPADLARWRQEGSSNVWLDPTGALPAALGHDALPILAYWDGSRIRWSGLAEIKTLEADLKNALQAPAP